MKRDYLIVPADLGAGDSARHHREMEEADRRKTESLSVLAHELRNPLGGDQRVSGSFL